MPSDWVKKCQDYRAKHGCSYKEAMIKCSSGKTKTKVGKGRSEAYKKVNNKAVMDAQRKANKVKQEENIFDTLGRTAKTLVANPRKTSRAFKHAFVDTDRGVETLNPTGKYGMFTAVEILADKKHPKHKKLQQKFEEGLAPLDAIAELDPTGASSEVLGALKGRGKIKKPRKKRCSCRK